MTVPLPPLPRDQITANEKMAQEWYAWFNQLYIFLTAQVSGGGGVLTALNTLNASAPLAGGGHLGDNLTISVQQEGITNNFLAPMASNTVKGNNLGASGPALDLPFVSGVYNATFRSGQVQFTGPNNLLTSTTQVEIGTNVPNPSGVNGPVLLLGTGGGNGTPASFWIITDEAFDSVTPGNTLGITAGETQPIGTAAGGLLWLIGGASAGGTGGEMRVQGGTSVTGPGGQLSLFGGNSTSGPAGDVFVTGGQAGTAGANVHLIATMVNGVSGDVRIRINSTILLQFLRNGEIFLTQSGTGAGSAGQPLVSGGLGAAAKWLSGAFTGTIATAKLNSTGSGGSQTFNNGILVSEVPASSTTNTGTINMNIQSATGSPAINFQYTQTENMMFLRCTAAVTGTATGNSLLVGNLPNFATPANIQIVPFSGLVNNNVAALSGNAIIFPPGFFGSSGVILFQVSTVSGANVVYSSTAFTGTIGVVSNACLYYSLN